MSRGILLAGEPMGLFIARDEGSLEDVSSFDCSIAGAEYNVAVGMKRLGHEVEYYTKLGQDPSGKRILTGMSKNGINGSDISCISSHPTGFMLKSKVSKGDPTVSYFRKGSAASTISKEDVEDLDLSRFSHLHLTGILPAISKSCMEASVSLMERARNQGLFISFDPNLRPTLWPSKEKMVSAVNQLALMADLVLPGINEGEILMGSRVSKEIARYYINQGVKAVVVKLGAEGAFVATENEELLVPGFPVEKIVDTVGAGDGFAVGVISGLMENLPLIEAVRRGNAIGAIQIMSVSDNEGLPTPGELESFMKGKRI